MRTARRRPSAHAVRSRGALASGRADGEDGAAVTYPDSRTVQRGDQIVGGRVGGAVPCAQPDVPTRRARVRASSVGRAQAMIRRRGGDARECARRDAVREAGAGDVDALFKSLNNAPAEKKARTTQVGWGGVGGQAREAGRA